MARTATNTPKTVEVTQEVILQTDDKSATTAVAPKKTNAKAKFRKSRKRTSLNEFAIVNDIRPEVIAGFRIWLKGDDFHFDDEWDVLFQEYMNR